MALVPWRPGLGWLGFCCGRLAARGGLGGLGDSHPGRDRRDFGGGLGGCACSAAAAWIKEASISEIVGPAGSLATGAWGGRFLARAPCPVGSVYRANERR